jgi:hypothetical protein
MLPCCSPIEVSRSVVDAQPEQFTAAVRQLCSQGVQRVPSECVCVAGVERGGEYAHAPRLLQAVIRADGRLE